MDVMSINDAWVARRRRWRDRMPWLSSGRSPSGELLYVTCKLCQRHDEKRAPRWRKPNTLQVCNFRRHEKTQRHQRAAATTEDMSVALHAPPAKDFVSLLQQFRRGKTHGDKGCDGVGRRKKVRKMKWCLAEAVRARVRAAIRSAESMSIHADCSKGHLVARALMCGKSLDVSDGLLGIVNMHDVHKESSAME